MKKGLEAIQQGLNNSQTPKMRGYNIEIRLRCY